MLSKKPNTIVVSVEQSDIDEGHRFSPHNCMVARGVRRELGEAFPYLTAHVGVSDATLCLTLQYNVSLPESVAQRMRDFDAGSKVVPFSFILELPEAVAKLVGA